MERIVIVGGGAAGLELAIKLGRKLGGNKLAEILLLDKERVHFWKPHLHELATGSISLDSHCADYLTLARENNFSFYEAEVNGIDRKKKVVRVKQNCDENGRELTPRCEIPYSKLVLAIGSKSNDFGVSGAKEFSLSLDSFKDAVSFQKNLVNAFLRANAMIHQGKKLSDEQLKIAIVGGGATGVELASELSNAMHTLAAYGYKAVEKQCELQITLIEAGERILKNLPESISEKVNSILRKRGVKVLENSNVTIVSEKSLSLSSGEIIPAELIVWAAGIKCASFLSSIGLETNELNQIITNTRLQSIGDKNIYTVGDCGCVPWVGGSLPFVPPRAQAASQQAKYLSDQFQRELSGKESQPWRYIDFGSLVSLGRYSTVGSLMAGFSGKAFFLEGVFAKFMYVMLYKMHEYSVRGFFKTLFLNISRGFFSQTKSRIKLH